MMSYELYMINNINKNIISPEFYVAYICANDVIIQSLFL